MLHDMKYATSLNIRRTAATPTRLSRSQAFTDYVAMVDRLSTGYLRPLERRLPARKAKAPA